MRSGAICPKAEEPGYYDAVLMDIRMPVMDSHPAKPYAVGKRMETLLQILS